MRKKLLLTLSIALLSCFLMNCSSDEDSVIENKITVGDTDFLLTNAIQLFVEESSWQENKYVFDLTLSSEGIVFKSIDENGMTLDGKGFQLSFSLLSDSKESLSSGTYLVEEEELLWSAYCIDWTDEKYESDQNKWIRFTSGELNIIKKDDMYVINFEGVDANGNDCDFSFIGGIEYYALQQL